ncbi:amino acid adenylation domain-containing protein [Podospora aff. communis PSN243]|uniref:Amino acid adenylation domain-containing protein n=1 Tax=Podospora aff. communis PSN243 TaxID=3040156 RepID=A0AAV9GAQ1_9PEZI|nr:amino acid adenylation domain-containing protein [Podospora aff. communis PSN243]
MDQSVVSAPFRSLDNLSPEDQRLFNLFGRGAVVKPPHLIVHHAFEAIAASHPDAVAVQQHDGASITYAELNRRANMLANRLKTTHGIKKGDRVLLVVSRSIEMVVFIFGVLKAGGQYVPVDGGVAPVETLAHQITDSGAPLVLCLPKHRAKVEQSIASAGASHVKVLDLDLGNRLWTEGDAHNPGVDVNPQDGAYVIYTSGTTGKPKGVDAIHYGVTHMLLVEPSKLGITVGKKVAQQLNVGFDMCAWEILATLMNGGTLCTRGSGDEAWTNTLRQVDIVISTPTIVLRRLPRHEDFPNLKTIVVGGEPCPKTLADYWAPHVNFLNVCGPTEITVLNTAHLHKQGELLTIGKPNPNTNLYILDEDENPAKIGEPGLMWVGGAGVSRGYLNLPELTAARFKPDKFTGTDMMFNTGDIGRWLPDGNIATEGRKDDQVKINGFRVELDGVSRAIEAHPDVIKGCALHIDGKLWGFYSAPVAISEEELKRCVGTHQPYYAVPAMWRHFVEIPLTPNGKLHKRALIDIARGAVDVSTHVVFEKGASSSSSSSSHDSKSGDDDDDKLPEPKKSIPGLQWLRYKGLSAYRKLFVTIMAANLAAFAVLLWQSRTSGFRLPLSSLSTAVSANLLASVLLRQDYVVNFIFWLATRPGTSAPLFIRRHLAHVYHYGGVHSGCSVAASLWWIVFTVSATIHFTDPKISSRQGPIVLALTYLILALLLAILTMAHPTLRAKLHNQFECTHRFAGWSALAFVWSHLIVTTTSQLSPSDSFGLALAKTPALYLLFLTTLSIALPWMRLRRVPVIPEPLSAHAIRLHFPTLPTPGPFASHGIRITDRPLVEWHAFACIPPPPSPSSTPTTTQPNQNVNTQKGLSILLSHAGDWTRHILTHPPSQIYTRGVPASGVLAIAPLFRSLVLVATGSGIGPCMPVLMQRTIPIRVIWSTRNPLRTYGQEIVDAVRGADGDAVVWDTEKEGRPDLVGMAWRVWKESGAECVCVVSNKGTTGRVVWGLERRGVLAYGPIWDS